MGRLDQQLRARGPAPSERADWPAEELLPPGLWLLRRFPWYSRPLDEVVWVPASEASHMLPADPVLAVPVNGRTYALPWWVMKNHHAANLVVEGEPLLVTLCERCTSAAAFSPELAGRRLAFMIVGSYRGTHVLGDLETRSIWGSFTGECLLGALTGARLGRRLLVQASWEEWRDRFPDALVALGEGEPRDGHGSEHSPGSAESPLGGYVFGDSRLPPAQLVLGVEAGGVARAYPLATLAARGRVVNDELGGVPLAVLSSPRSWIAAAFERAVEGRELVLRADGEAFRDRQTGSTWDILGRATAGSLAGTTLPALDGGVEEWQAWAAYHPDTEIHPGPS